jgi:uncharacterized protein YbaP (TraB family)
MYQKFSKTIFNKPAWICAVLFIAACASNIPKAWDKELGYSYADNENTLLWEISGNGLKKPSYLYGTIHIKNKKVFQYDTIVTHLFNYADIYTMEINMDEINPIKAAKCMMMEDDIKNYLSEAEYMMLDSFLYANTGTKLETIRKQKPFFITSLMAESLFGGDMKFALDLDFYMKAKMNKKEVTGIEKFEEQMAAVDSITIREQIELVLESLNDTLSPTEQADKMINTYISGNLNDLMVLMNDYKGKEKFERIFIINRNHRMADRISENNPAKSYFIAIGAAHLPGKEGVIELLKKKGFSVKPIKTSFNK